MSALENVTALNSKNYIVHTKYLWLFILSYSMVFVAANWFDPRLINIFGLDTGAGAIIFPITYLISDLITEVYGYKAARLTIWVGFFFNSVFLLYGQLIIHLPIPENVNNEGFDLFVHYNIRIIIAAVFSYLLGEPLNAYFISKLKVFFNGRYIGIRFVLSTLIATSLNVILFCTSAFYGVMNNNNFIFFMLNSWLFMVCIEFLLLPISIRLAQKIKQLERFDMYDRRTNFNLFSFDVKYNLQDNEYARRKLK